MKELLFNNYKIKTISGIINFFSNLSNNDILIEGDISKIMTIFDITDKEIDINFLIRYMVNQKKYIRSVVKFISNNTNYIDFSRMDEFIKYKCEKPNDSGSKKYLTLMYGESKGLEMFKDRQKKFSKFYDVEYYIKQGYSEKESLEKIKEYKKKKSTTLENFVIKYGEIDGKEKYYDYVNKSINNIENFKIRYGNKWEDKWKVYTSKDSSSYNWALKKANGDTEIANKIFTEKNNKTKITLDLLVEKYGEKEGKDKWFKINKSKDNSSLNYFIRKFGNESEGINKYVEHNKTKDSSSLMFFEKKYGEQGFDKYNQKRILSDNKSMDFFLSKYGNYKLAKEEYINTQKKIKVKVLSASKSSLVYFKPLYDFLIVSENVKRDNIFLGVEGSQEYFIKTEDDIFFYDFVLLDKKIIIEYNGKFWHPNWEYYSIEECVDKFKNKKIDNIKMINRDKEKIKVAKDNGFKVLILWEEDGKIKNFNKLKHFLNENDIRYEN